MHRLVCTVLSLSHSHCECEFVSLYQVCSTWHTVSRSELLWETLTRQIWKRQRRLQPTWREEYLHRHRTAHNFRRRRAVHRSLEFNHGVAAGGRLTCRCLALSTRHLACGFLDGSVRLFDLRTAAHVRTFQPRRRDRLGPFSCAISGIVLDDARVVFASFYGDVHVAAVGDPGPTARRARRGDAAGDGALVDFAGHGRWWVGLFAGAPRRALQVWDSTTEQLVFVGGSLTDADALLGWRLLTDFDDAADGVGRVRVAASSDSGVAATQLKLLAFDLRHLGLVLGEEVVEHGVVVDSLDVSNDMYLVIDKAGMARVRKLRSFEEVCTFVIRRGRGEAKILGCLNGGYAFVSINGAIQAWDVENGQFLYRLRERIGMATGLVADDDHVAGCSIDNGIHLWTFSAA